MWAVVRLAGLAIYAGAPAARARVDALLPLPTDASKARPALISIRLRVREWPARHGEPTFSVQLSVPLAAPPPPPTSYPQVALSLAQIPVWPPPLVELNVHRLCAGVCGSVGEYTRLVEEVLASRTRLGRLCWGGLECAPPWFVPDGSKSLNVYFVSMLRG
ncbi:uncharacterized protein C8Q71DRAFT_766048 [Rhodofomes roseus]|uniref:Uncharacterized protein n=1 Tax=Rhodofomes roseus TaxID=34475 RepID=A0ABQ8KB06_9APHY|nr:uncharacterized protein C8Q71DRAFT_766048 [Rhodofomes roseus]KAH9834728.1 hypothetical protein C8Q71DRAFT_766048 [Rhodofomes roseus]